MLLKYTFVGIYAFLSSIFVYLNAPYLDGDFENYRQAYYGEYKINELGFNFLVYIFNALDVSYFTFFVCVNIIAVLSLYNMHRYYNMPYWYIYCTSTYVIYYLSAGHFRSIMPFMMFAASGRLQSNKIFLGVLFHYGYLLVYLYYIIVQIFNKFNRNCLFIFGLFLFSIAYLLVLNTVYLNEMLTILGMDRFQQLYVTNELVDIHENRNIFSLSNIKLYLLFILLFLINYGISGSVIKIIFSIYPIFYITFSFDAYIAQKSILFLEPLAICAAAFIENLTAKYMYTVIILIIYIYSILTRWEFT